MSATFTLSAELRTDKGKGASRRLRHAGKTPAIIYGTEKEPAMVMFRHDDLLHATEDEAFFSHILTINYDGNSEKVIIKDLQRHPAKLQIMHADFQRIDETHALHVNVPLHFINEETSVGVKAGGKVSHLMTEIEITCMPSSLPEFIEVDMSNVNTGDTVQLSDLKLPEGVTSVVLSHGEGHDQAIANISMLRGGTEEENEEASEE
jgi:large subunit ribosomal protein L25